MTLGKDGGLIEIVDFKTGESYPNFPRRFRDVEQWNGEQVEILLYGRADRL